MSDYRGAARQIVDPLGDTGTRDLLRLLESDDVIRAEVFRQLHERGGHDSLLDALTDLEADPVMRGWLIEHLPIELGA